MRRSVQAPEDPSVKRPLKFSVGSDDEDDKPSSSLQKPSVPIIRHIRDTHSPPTYAHVRVVRFFIHVFPKILVILLPLFFFVILFVAFFLVILLPGTWREALCVSYLFPLPPLPPNTNLTFIAHRGCEFPYPENSVHALRHGAKQLGFVEFDISLTSDGHVVLMHDNSLERTTNGTGLTCNRPLSYIQQLELKRPERDPTGKITHATFCSNKSPAGRSVPCTYRVPTLESVLDELPDDTKMMIDVKRCYVEGVSAAKCSNCTLLLERTKSLLEKFFVKPENVVFSSSQTESLRVIQKGMPPGSKYALSMDAPFTHYKRSSFMDAFTKGTWDAAALPVGLVARRPDLVRLIRNLKMPNTSADRDVYAWTIRRDTDYRLARCVGVSSMVVAEPDRIRKKFAGDVEEALIGEGP